MLYDLRDEEPDLGASIIVLTATCARYVADSPDFGVGDLVTYRADAPVSEEAKDRPFVLLELRRGVRCEPNDGDPTEFTTGRRLDARLAFVQPCGDVCAIWAESWQLERYERPADARTRENVQ